MATVNKTLKAAAAEIGYNRWNDPNPGTKYGRWYAEITRTPYFGQSGVPYCAMFVSWVLNQVGQACAGFPTASCTQAVNGARKAGRILSSKYDARAGDIVIFDWDPSKGNGVDHVGFVELNKGSYIQTIEGNTSSGNSGSQSNGGGVYRRTRNWSTVAYIIRPLYSSTDEKVETEEEKAARLEKERVDGLPQSLKKFSDLWPTEWYIHGVQKAVEGKVMNGTSNTTFEPGSALTRAQAVAILANKSGEDIEPMPFSDIAPWYTSAILWASEKGYIAGNDGKARPDDGVTRHEFCIFLNRFYGSKMPIEYPMKFIDWDSVPEYAKNSVAWCVEVGIINGNGNMLRPNDICTRAEAACMAVALD